MLLLILSFLVSFFLGYLFLNILWPENNGYVLIKASLVPGLGLGISSLLSFIWLLLTNNSRGNFCLILTEIVFLLLLYLIFIWKKKDRQKSVSPVSTYFIPTPEAKIQFGLEIIFYLMLVLAILSFLFLTLDSPLGYWDAWSIWNLRARWIFRGGMDWRDAFKVAPEFQPDYPLLLPLSIFRTWKYTGYEILIAPIFIAFLFAIGTTGLLVSSLVRFRSVGQGFLAGIVLLGTPFFIIKGADQYADVPLSFFYLATFVFFYLSEKLMGKSKAFSTLAGVTTGLAIWTKNEGMLFLLAFVLSWVLVKRHRTGLKKLGGFSLGLMPILGVVLYFKRQLAPFNDLIAVTNFAAGLKRSGEPSRYLLILKSFCQQFFLSGKFFFIPLTLILPVYLFLAKTGIKKEAKDVSVIMALTLTIVLIGYFVIYLLTPHDLNWHLGTSLNRLFLQLWPVFLFAYFLVVKTPEEAWAKSTLPE
ncbi:MAG: hypothetical protein V2A65_08100 [Candidatus Omnitrophota bacterium]